MDEDQIVELGARARALLSSKTFEFVVNHLATQYQNAIILSKPVERQLREENYFSHKALNDICAQLSSYVQQADALIKAREAKEEDEDNGD